MRLIYTRRPRLKNSRQHFLLLLEGGGGANHEIEIKKKISGRGVLKWDEGGEDPGVKFEYEKK